ncbi:Bypass of stop codon 6-like protein [Cladobotryum mycophilum]|uniref:Bypass of stop codon 6-like protein n=1 Tax=Cladobotryum mycophilum TaxID=491253 RepID=A0ABR0SMV8_9HYPO
MTTTITDVQHEIGRIHTIDAVELGSLGSVTISGTRSGSGSVSYKPEVAARAPYSEPASRILDDGDLPLNARTELERWNRPRANTGRLAFAFLSFVIAGMNDAAVGALIPSLGTYYDLSYTTVSLIFLTPFVGYSVAALTNAKIHVKFGQRGVAIMAPACHIITYSVLCSHPPYPALVVCNAVSGFGNGLTDACFSAWVGSLDKGSTLQGILHSFCSVGSLFSPLIATSMVVKADLPWYTFYFVMLGVSGLELVGLTVVFWDKTGAIYQKETAHQNAGSSGAGTREALKSRVTWLCSLFFFCYIGIEVSLGGWIVTFMQNVRHASRYNSGISATGFWAGMALGRASLGAVNERFGERLCLSIYLAICLCLQLLFWLVPQFVVSAVAVAFLGFFLGPVFPGAVMLTAKLLPKRIHVSAIGFAMAVGEVLQPIIVALIAVVALIWLNFPRIKKRD